MHEIFPGIFRWTRSVKPGVTGASLWIQTIHGPVVVDPFIPEGGIDQIQALGAPHAVILTTHRHERDAAAYEARFGVRRYVNGKPDSPISRRGVRFQAGARVLDTFDTVDLGGISAGETGLLLGREGGILILGDAFLNIHPTRSPLTWIFPVILPYGPPQPYPVWMSRGPRTSRIQLAAIGELAFKHLLPSHGDPILADARERVLAAIDSERRAHGFLFSSDGRPDIDARSAPFK